MTKEQNINFEESLEKLNTLIEKMEQGNLPLEMALEHFEKGIALIRQCQQALNQAEQKVKILIEKNGQPSLENFHDNE